MYRFKCPVCGEEEYSSVEKETKCIHCGRAKSKKQDTLEEPEGDTDDDNKN